MQIIANQFRSNKYISFPLWFGQFAFWRLFVSRFPQQMLHDFQRMNKQISFGIYRKDCTSQGIDQ